MFGCVGVRARNQFNSIQFNSVQFSSIGLALVSFPFFSFSHSTKLQPTNILYSEQMEFNNAIHHVVYQQCAPLRVRADVVFPNQTAELGMLFRVS